VAYSGAHDATIAAVASGKVQAGALNISVWEKFVADKKVDTAQGARLLHHAALLRLQLDGARRHAGRPARKAHQALLALNPATPQGAEILKLQRATRFVPTKAENYKPASKSAATGRRACCEGRRGTAR
jgi:phosphonate transport system substrate-binding protein